MRNAHLHNSILYRICLVFFKKETASTSNWSFGFTGLVRDLKPGPFTRKTRIMPLDQRATII